MNEHNIGVAATADVESLAGPQCNNPHVDSGLSLEQRKQVAE